MADKKYKLEILAVDHMYSMDELCQRLHLDSEFVLQCIDHGIAETRSSPGRQHALFPASELLKLQKAARLQRDFELDYGALALVLDLLDDLDSLRKRVGELNRRLERWENGYDDV